MARCEARWPIDRLAMTFGYSQGEHSVAIQLSDDLFGLDYDDINYVEKLEFDLGLNGSLGASVDPLAGTTAANGKPIWSPAQIAAYLNRSGASWTNGPNAGVQSDANLNEVTFGFHDSQESLERNGYVYTTNGVDYFALSEYFQFGAFNAAQQNAARYAMLLWDDVAAISFRETNIDDADITFGNLTNSPNTQAYSRLPAATVTSDPAINAQIRDIVGDVWVSNAQASNFQLDPGGYGLNTLVHEIGHSLGLSHPGSYNFGPNFTATYANGAEYYQDVRNYSIMSYWNPRDIGTRDYNWNVMAIAYGSTPMVHDILAIQTMYGVDSTTRTGDTVYGFNSTADRDVFNFNVNEAPTVTIWDAGGVDTLDASGYGTDQVIDLNPGSLSSIGGVTQADAATRLTFEQVNINRAELGYAPVARATYDANMAALAANGALGRLVDNVGIAYGATIENAVGGSGNDTLIGNAVANVLTGNAGIDTVSYRSAIAGVNASLATGGISGYAAGDTYVGIENLEGSAFVDSLYGDANANVLSGLAGGDLLSGLGGNDTLFGGDGNDRLDGGADNDRLDGGIGNDTLLGGTGLDVLLGGDGNDQLDGGADNDQLDGGIGNDTLLGGTGLDTLLGGDGNDSLDGGADDDQLDGGIGNDVLIGGSGNDLLLGGDGTDRLDGGIGADRLLGGLGADTLTGGAGNDVFAFTTTDKVTDIITDFVRGQDKVDLTGIDAIAARDGVQAFRYIGGGNFTGGQGGQLRFYTEGNNGFLAGDVDGDRVADFTIRLDGVTRFQVGDLILA